MNATTNIDTATNTIADTYLTGAESAKQIMYILSMGPRKRNVLEKAVVDYLHRKGFQCSTRKNVSLNISFLMHMGWIYTQNGQIYHLGTDHPHTNIEISLLYREWCRKGQRAQRIRKRAEKAKELSRQKPKTVSVTSELTENYKVPTITVNGIKLSGDPSDLAMIIKEM